MMPPAAMVTAGRRTAPAQIAFLVMTALPLADFCLGPHAAS